eukprot:TRINITY_DN1886_c0_g1_i1.p1 TRINITY_DN1886_c0_g1~~TRINITY_DN1886_c0_g1_i1.p1  ORF type:complete len:133 (-),score=6.36 TRINITY_DN1886_c0_g1_i1:772-1170(-)
MCIVLLALNHKGYKLIILVNRDEYLDRPTSPASWWETDEILASRDLVGGGIQFGVTKQGRFAVLTNYREKHEVTGFSRGTLTLDFLKYVKECFFFYILLYRVLPRARDIFTNLFSTDCVKLVLSVTIGRSNT